MATVDEALKSQVRNIEATYGRTMREWTALIKKSGLTKHSDVVAMLKRDHGVTHGAAHRISLVAREEEPKTGSGAGAAQAGADVIAAMLGAERAQLRAIVDRLVDVIRAHGDFELAPKKGYLSLRRRKQFGMIKPAAKHVDVGLILVGVPVKGRLESAAGFNALFTHRVRVLSVDEVDRELRGWLRRAHEAAQ